MVWVVEVMATLLYSLPLLGTGAVAGALTSPLRGTGALLGASLGFGLSVFAHMISKGKD